MVVRWLPAAQTPIRPSQHALWEDSSPVLMVPAKVPAFKLHDWVWIVCLSLNSLPVAGPIQTLGLRCGVAPPLELHKLRVGEGWFPKGNSKCAIYYPKEVVGARQAKPTAIHSVHPFRTTNRIFQKADFDRMRDRLVWQPFFLHIFLPFEEKPLWTISSSSCKIATSAYTTWSL